MTVEPSVSEYYNFVGDDYFKQYQRSNLKTSREYPANYFRLQILVRLLAEAGAKSVYEVGVGEGTPLVTMASLGLRVAGCDIAEKMVARARATFEEAGLSPDLIQWGDVEDSTTFSRQLNGGRFDAVVAAGVMPHIRNDEHVLKNMGMIVRPGGKALVEFRNKLFSLFTMNRYTKEFILDDLLRDVSPSLKQVVAEELDRRLATELPKVRAVSGADGEGPGYDRILSKFHNPFELMETFARCGFTNVKVHWYHYHAVPPLLEGRAGNELREASLSLEHEGSWRGMFLCSAGVIEADRL
jgi:2-polyprenyl-3-methyl-5-hydroxy-6-metoxy-1,4-benzoquinol methylase